MRNLTVSTVAFERKKEELYGFRQTELLDSRVMNLSSRVKTLNYTTKVALILVCFFHYQLGRATIPSG